MSGLCFNINSNSWSVLSFMLFKYFLWLHSFILPRCVSARFKFANNGQSLYTGQLLFGICSENTSSNICLVSGESKLCLGFNSTNTWNSSVSSVVQSFLFIATSRLFTLCFNTSHSSLFILLASNRLCNVVILPVFSDTRFIFIAKKESNINNFVFYYLFIIQPLLSAVLAVALQVLLWHSERRK